MKIRASLIVGLSSLVVVVACARNGVEGDVVFVGTNQPAVGVTVQASTSTNLKEEMSKARKTARTNAAGHFRIGGLIADHGYQISVEDAKWSGESRNEQVPETGTVVMNKPIEVCPVPPSAGAWVFPDPAEVPTPLRFDEAKRVRIRVHAGLIGGGFGNVSAFSVSEADINRTIGTLPRRGLLVLADAGVQDIGQLHRIQGKVVSLGSMPAATIEPGWYYNVSDFYGKDHMIVGWQLLNAVVAKPNMPRMFKSTRGSLIGVPLAQLSSGLYILTTDVASGQRASELFGGESQPREGFIVQVR